MRRALFIAVLVLTVAPMGVGQEQSATVSHGTSVEEAIRKLDNERIQAQIHADATARRRSLQRMVGSNPKRVERPAQGAFWTIMPLLV